MRALVSTTRSLLEGGHSGVDVPLRGSRKEFHDAKAKGVLLHTDPVSR
jgi:hypothetical protein